MDRSPPPWSGHSGAPAISADRPGPPWSRAAVVAFLTQVLEAERAGARLAAALGQDAPDEPSGDLLVRVALADARFCSLLVRHITRLHGIPTAAADPSGMPGEPADFAEGLHRLRQGEEEMARHLETAMLQVSDEAVRRDLAEMRAVHDEARQACDRVLADRP